MNHRIFNTLVVTALMCSSLTAIAKERVILFGDNEGKSCRISLRDIDYNNNDQMQGFVASFAGSMPRQVGSRLPFHFYNMVKSGSDYISKEMSDGKPVVEIKAYDGEFLSSSFQSDGEGFSCSALTTRDPKVGNCDSLFESAESGTKLIECHEVVSSDVNTYYSSTEDFNDYVNTAKVCIREDGISYDPHTLKYSASITHKRQGVSATLSSSQVSMKENKEFFTRDSGVVKLKEYGKDPNQEPDDAWRVKYDKDEKTLELFHGTNSYLSFGGFKYAAHVKINFKNCSEYTKN
ncbi:hypothetical protein HBN50_03450 [Halobacteriovorax sp. GB3]|uniref:hypothetical protein n=1 Tax=Halobacteriovorax sp. GB3 TaxID=2719615 RepID=UPI00235F83FA|nr:hypothetical protein [Halobacteriovorax sp. GB3]MDD0852133.1 hypothetical protein [Halobacteriovorax sp. GB3]